MNTKGLLCAVGARAIAVLCAAMGLLCLPLRAQVTTADILGAVTDASGAVLPGVRVTAENLDTSATRSAVSDSTGNYLIPLLPPGPYSVKAEMQGFKTFTVPRVVLAVGDRLRVDVRLEVGQLEQSVEVTAQTPALQSEKSSVGTLVNDRAVEDLPLNGRNFVTLARLAAGATEGVNNALSSGNRPDDRRRASSVAVNGQPDTNNNFLIDGMDDNERFIGTIIVKPSMDALAEFRVETNLYSAEIGRTAGGVINLITKSGTNDLHGSLFEFFRNEHLDAKNFFAGPGPTPAYKQNQFGGSLGGPFKKNKTFFFGDYEGFRLRQGQTFTSTVPTLAMRQGNFAGVNPIFDPTTTRSDPSRPGVSVRDRFPNDQIPASLIDPVAAKVVALYPIPQTGGLVNNFTQNPAKTQRDDTFDAKIDQHFSDRDIFFARYSFNDTNTFLPPQLPKIGNIQAGGDTAQFAGASRQRAQGLHLNFVHTFRPNLLAEFKAGYARYAIHTLPPNYGNNVDQQLGIPGGNVDADSSGLTQMVIAGFRGLGDSNFIPIITINNVFQYVGSVTYNRSGHNIKAGADIRRRQTSPFQSPQARGQFSFDGNFTNDPSGDVARSGNSIASLLLGYPSATVRSKYLVVPGFRNTEFAVYLQDDWRVTRWLTLNLGLRYEIFTPQHEVANRISNVDLAAGKIIIAGQNGVSGSAGVPGDYNNFGPRFGFAATVTPRTVVRGGFGINYYPIFFGSTSALRNPPFVSLYSVSTTPLTPINRISDGFPLPTPTDPLNPTGNLTAMALDLRNPYVAQFNLMVQREIVSGTVWNIGYVGALTRKDYIAPNVNFDLPGPGAIQPRRPYVSKFPNVQSIALAGNWGTGDYHSLQTGVEHRFRSGLNLVSNYTWSHLIDDYPVVGGGKVGQGPWPQLVNNLHLERGNSDIDIRHRWTLMANYQLPFGRSLTGWRGVVAKGWQVNGIAVLQSGPTMTVQNGSPRANTGSGDRPNQIAGGNLPADQRSTARWFNTAAFVPQPLFQIGNAGRNTLFAPGRGELDFSLFKEFKPTERTTLQFRAEAFNITNTPNFGVPGNQLGTAAFGVISDTANTLPRNLQFALKLLF